MSLLIDKKSGKPRLKSTIYVLPNLLTTGNLFFGFFSIIKSEMGDFTWAASAILLAAVFDVLDGRVARLTGGTSEFGVQYDSLCDLISFGLAPAFLMYKFGLSHLGRVGWNLCFVFLACGALRLARFNVQSSFGKSKGDFTGLPIPMAAATVACFIATSMDFQVNGARNFWLLLQLEDLFNKGKFNDYTLATLSPMLAFAMVSNFAYRSHKAIKISVVKPFKLLVIFVITTAFVAYQPELFGLVFCAMYALSGPIEWMLGWKKSIDDDEIFTPLASDEDEVDGEDHQEQTLSSKWHETLHNLKKE